jgi:hypothetical protein
MLACGSMADCTGGEVCCGSYTPPTTFGTSCLAACASLPIVGAVQICKQSTECTGGATCGTPTNSILAGALMGMMVCNAPTAEGGTSSSGGSDSGAEGGSSSGASEGGSDAASD